MSEHMKVYEQVREVPAAALKEIKGGRLKGMSDINPMWRIKMLTEVFGICGFGWKTEIVNQRFEQGAGDVISCFVDINLFVKMDGEWSAPIPGMGGSSFVAMEKGALHTSDECFKMAYTDAISVACKSLGFAADVYFANDRTKYSNQEDNTSSRASQRPAQTRQQEYGQSHQQSPRNDQQAPRAQARVYKLREQIGMEWAGLNKLASNVLEREIKFLKSDVKTEEEWEKIENALKEAV